MPLTIQQDGSTVGGQPNTVVAKWWNDYHDLLTGAMTDQDVTLSTDLILKPMSALPAAPTANAQAGTGLGIGVYQYAIVFAKVGQLGFSGLGATTSVTTASGNQAVGLSNIPLGPAGTSGRLVYRTKVGGSTFFYVASIGNNTATTYIDTTADTSLTALPNPAGFGGTLVIQDATGTTQTTLFSDGSASIGGSFSANAGGYIHAASAGADDALFLYDRSDTYGGVFGWGQSGGGLYFYDTVHGGYVFSGGTKAGITFTGSVAAGATISQQGSPVALTGSHSAAQIEVSYGSGVPATLGSNEIYFQIS